MGHRKQNKESTAVATPVKPVAEETATPSPDPTSVKQSFSKSYTRAFKQIAVPGKRAPNSWKKEYKDLKEFLKKREDKLKRRKSNKEPKPIDVLNKAYGTKAPEYLVEMVLDTRKKANSLVYYVLWEGYSLSDASWESEANVTNLGELRDAFHERFPRRPGGIEAQTKGKGAKKESSVTVATPSFEA